MNGNNFGALTSQMGALNDQLQKAFGGVMNVAQGSSGMVPI